VSWLAGTDSSTRRGLPANEVLAPLPVLAVLALVGNDWLLKPSGAPEWITGKLSDLAGVFVFPLVLTAAADLALYVAVRGRADFTLRRWKLAAAIAATAVAFAATKLSQPVADLVARATAALFGRGEVMADPYDLIALPLLALTWWHGRRTIARGPYGRLEFARRHNLTAPFADAVACGADPEIVAAVHQSLERGDGIDAALDRLRAGCSR